MVKLSELEHPPDTVLAFPDQGKTSWWNKLLHASTRTGLWSSAFFWRWKQDDHICRQIQTGLWSFRLLWVLPCGSQNVKRSQQLRDSSAPCAEPGGVWIRYLSFQQTHFIHSSKTSFKMFQKLFVILKHLRKKEDRSESLEGISRDPLSYPFSKHIQFQCYSGFFKHVSTWVLTTSEEGGFAAFLGAIQFPDFHHY